ncbi:unnamed protein product [marine sediment metagenome]|uniref:tRNA (guanine(46)-N(7))-methyltransferase n=1 Tax=marine sediment metagenome TaxID=412755 RepID=X1CBN0_9ZZZZ
MMSAQTDKADDHTTRVFLDDWLHPMDLKDIFSTPQPLEVDIGCGKGRFLLARAAAYPHINFLGVDRMLRRIRKLDRKLVRGGYENARLLRADAYYATTYLLPPAAVRAYYIFFPDPWPKKRHHDHRLFNALYLDALYRTLEEQGIVHVATDHLPYFEQIHKVLTADARFKETEAFVPIDDERTDFELRFLGKTEIGRCSFVKA